MEENIYPYPEELQEVGAAERAEIANLIEAAERAVSSAILHDWSQDGTYFLHISNDVELAETGNIHAKTFTLARISWANVLNNYEVRIGEEDVSRVVIAEDGQGFEGSHADLVLARARAIDGGRAKGRHYVTVAKELTQGSAIMVSIGLERISEGDLAPRTVLDLCMTRSYANGMGAIMQVRHIESNPNTGEMKMGDKLAGDEWLDNDSAKSFPARVLLTNPMPEMTAAELQGRFYPPTPVNGVLDSNAWNRLITQPLDLRDRLQDY